MSTLHTHDIKDWCHICGIRRVHLADVWYPENAEHRKEVTQYIRICSVCAELIAKVSRGETEEVVETDYPDGVKHRSKYESISQV